MKAAVLFTLGQLVLLGDAVCPTTVQKVKPSPEDKDFGDVVAIQADRLAVGGDVPTTGKIWIFKKTDSGWTFEFEISPSESEDTEKIGDTFSFNGDATELVAGTRSRSFPAHVFKRSGSSWTKTYTVELGSKYASSNDMGEKYMHAWKTAIDGDTFAISTRVTLSDSDGQTSTAEERRREKAGRVWVFVRSGNSWAQQQIIETSDAHSGHQFGVDIDLKGDDLAVGAPRYFPDKDNPIGIGAVFVFTRSGTTWSEQVKIMPPEPTTTPEPDCVGADCIRGSGRVFGYSVDFGKTGQLAIGDYGAENTAERIGVYGAIYVYERSSTASGPLWTIKATLNTFQIPNSKDDAFARRVVMSENDIIVASAYEESTTAENSGAVYYFYTNPESGQPMDSWNTYGTIKAPDARANHKYGTTIGISNDGALAVGAAYHGAAYVYDALCPTTTTLMTSTTEERLEASASYSLELAKPFVVFTTILPLAILTL